MSALEMMLPSESTEWVLCLYVNNMVLHLKPVHVKNKNKIKKIAERLLVKAICPWFLTLDWVHQLPCGLRA